MCESAGPVGGASKQAYQDTPPTTTSASTARATTVRTSSKGREEHDRSRSLMEDGRSARLRHCTDYGHAAISSCWHTQADTPHHQSIITHIAQHHRPLVHPRDRQGWGTKPSGHAARRNSLSTMQLNGASGLRAVRDSANASRNWLQRRRRTMMASASLGGGALACARAVDSAYAARARGLAIYGRDSSHCLSHLAS
jgi:hypothetical protein